MAFFRIHSQGKGREFGVSLEDVDLEFNNEQKFLIKIKKETLPRLEKILLM